MGRPSTGPTRYHAWRAACTQPQPDPSWHHHASWVGPRRVRRGAMHGGLRVRSPNQIPPGTIMLHGSALDGSDAVPCMAGCVYAAPTRSLLAQLVQAWSDHRGKNEDLEAKERGER